MQHCSLRIVSIARRRTFIAVTVAFVLAAPSLAVQKAQLRSYQRITAPVRDAGVYHVATGSWTRHAAQSAPASTLIGGTMDTVYACTSPSGYFAALDPGQVWSASGRIPSTSATSTLWNPAALPDGSVPGVGQGCANAYQIDGFQVAYCTDQPGSVIQMTIAFFESWNPVCTSSLSALAPQGGPFALSGLPGRGVGPVGCWVFAVDLSATTSSFAVQADGDGTENGVDAFGWTFTFPSTTSTLVNTGPLLAGAPSDASGPGSACHPAHPGVGWMQFPPSVSDEAAGYDSRRFDTVIGACAPTYPLNGSSFAWPGATTTIEAGSDMLGDDAFRIDGGMTVAPGCYFFSGPASGAPPNGPYSNFHLELYAKVACSVPANDDCSASQIVVGPGPHAFNNSTATTGTQGQTSSACLAYGVREIDNDLWFEWTAPSTATFVVSTCGLTLVDTKVAVYSGSGCPPGGAVACSDDACGLQSLVPFFAAAGQVFTIQIGSSPGAIGGFGSFTIQPASPTVGSDSCTTPTLIAGFGNFPFDNTTATTGTQGQSESLCNQLGTTAIWDDVWFAWTAPSTGAVLVSTCGTTTVDTKIAVYNGSSCAPSGSALGCSDNACGLQSAVGFNAVAGNQYLIQVGTSPGTHGGQGTIAAKPVACPPVAGSPPANDACASSPPIELNPPPRDAKAKTREVDTSGAMPTSATAPTCSGSSVSHDAWFCWTAPSSGGSFEFSVCPECTTQTGGINVYTSASACSPMQTCFSSGAAGCSVYGSNCGIAASTGCVGVNANQTYMIQVGTVSGAAFANVTVQINPCGTVNPGMEFCAGDGLMSPPTTSCPCGNFGAAGNGCGSSFNASGAHLTATGSVPADSVVLAGTGMNPAGVCVFLKGNVIDPNAFVFGDGITCTGGSLVRLRSVALSGGAASFPVPPETITLSARGGNTVGSGQLASYAVFYRNAAAAFCPPSTFNISNSYKITW